MPWFKVPVEQIIEYKKFGYVSVFNVDAETALDAAYTGNFLEKDVEPDYFSDFEFQESLSNWEVSSGTVVEDVEEFE